MKKIWMLFLLLPFLVGCANKEELKIFRVDKSYVEALRYTKKGDIAISLENKALLIATYLNPLGKCSGDKECFFVRVYIDNDFEDPKKAGLFHPGYSLTLNGHKPLQIKELKKENLLVKQMPLSEPWYHFYLVTFPKVQPPLQLTFSHPSYGSVTLPFEAAE